MRLGWGQVLKDILCHIECELYSVGQRGKSGDKEGRKYRSLKESLCFCFMLGLAKIGISIREMRGGRETEDGGAESSTQSEAGCPCDEVKCRGRGSSLVA